MNVWLKAALYVVGGMILGEITNEIFFNLLNTPSSGVNLTLAAVPAILASAVKFFMFYKAFMVIKNRTKAKNNEE